MRSFVIRNARLDGRDGLCDLVVENGIIRHIGSAGAASGEMLDAAGGLLTPGFAESHIHLDKACLLETCHNPEGTLAGAVASVSAAKRRFTADDIYARGRRVIEKAIAEGTNAMRTHVEIDPVIGLTGFKAVRRLKADYGWAIDIDICVFPQEGLLNNPGTEELLREALTAGADLVGGCPYMDSEPFEHIERVFKLAGAFNVDVDFHLDFDLDPTWRHLDAVAAATIAHGWQGRVAVGHVTKLSVIGAAELDRTASMLRDAGIAVTVLPATDLFLMAFGQEHSVARGVAPAHRLLKAGVECTIATNNVLNPFTPFGDASLLRMANLFANVSHLGSLDALADCFAMIGERPARMLGRRRCIEVGAPATFVVLPASSPALSVAEIARPIWGMKDGRLTFEHPQARLFPPSGAQQG